MSKAKPSQHAPEEIDAYLAALPEDDRSALESLRSIIRGTAPDCTERVSYGIPIFRLNKDLVGISAQKNHCSLHTMSPPLTKAMAEALEGVKVSGATIHFTPENPLPRELVVEIVRERVATIERWGLEEVMDALARRIAQAFVHKTRFDPFHVAETEQTLHDRLPGWLERLSREDRLALSLSGGGRDHEVEVVYRLVE